MSPVRRIMDLSGFRIVTPMTAKLSTVALRTIAGWIVLCVGLSQLGVVDSFTANYQATTFTRCFPVAVSAPKSSSRAVVTKFTTGTPTEVRDSSLVRLHSKPPEKEVKQDGGFLRKLRSKTPRALVFVASQSAVIGVALSVAAIIGTPNYGLGPEIEFSAVALLMGSLFAVPPFALPVLLCLFDKTQSALPEGEQRLVLALMGGKFRPLYSLVTCVTVGLMAGFGEEMLFRGIFQYEVARRWGNLDALYFSGIVFGLVHGLARAIPAMIASVYFGAIYIATGNLAVPITCHAVYDIVLLLYAHWTVCQLPPAKQRALFQPKTKTHAVA
jgi:membrane protease YdiL (CAAX protease family)